MGANWEENLELVEVAALTLAGLTFLQINFSRPFSFLYKIWIPVGIVFRLGQKYALRVTHV